MRWRVGVLQSRVSRRLVGLFVAAALLPLAATAWISSAAVAQLIDRMSEHNMAQSTRQASLQVFDRLMAAKALLIAWPQDHAGHGEDPQLSDFPGGGRIFRGIAHFGTDGHERWAAGSDADLVDEWNAAVGDDLSGSLNPAKAGDATVRLRWMLASVPSADGDSSPGQPAHGATPGGLRVFLAVAWDGRVRWLVELSHDYLWGPINDLAVTSGWRVQDAVGPTLLTAGEQRRVPAPVPAGQRMAQQADQSTSPLFLAAEFGSRPWLFTQHEPVLEAQLLGLPLARWLALVGFAALLFVALVSLGQIRRTLVPLEQLTEVTRRLGEGDSEARVRIDSHDEFGTLGVAFNDMAQRLDHQVRALAGLAVIDRDILSGATVEAVIDHVVDQLAQRYPDAVVAVAWLEPGAPSTMRSTVREGAGGARQRTRGQALDAAGQALFAQIRTDQVHPRGTLLRQPWCTPVRREGVQQLALLPVRGTEGETRALLVLGLKTSTASAALRDATELRDRLTVALAARQREQALMHRAGHDSLTGLLNRHGLAEGLDRCLGDARAMRCAVLFIDLDHFKDINDSLGHEAGDQVLCEVARRLRGSVPDAALLGRPGGDEFVLVLPQADEGAAGAVATRLARQLSRPIVLQGSEHVLGASIGIALAPQHGACREDLLRRADMAMYAAKSRGRAQWAMFDAALDKAAQARMRQSAELRRAVERSEFVAFYQPRVSVSDGRNASAEALVRWQHPERGLLGPGEFIALAEESDLIEGIGVFMLKAACAQLAQWRHAGGPIERVSVNVSARQLVSGRLPAQVRTALAEHGVPPGALELEVTESLLVGDASNAWAQLSDLRRLGVKIALDDFGTGYSSMATLRQLPIDVMKVDRAFVKDLDKDAGALAITRAIVTLARTLKLHVVAEGVETEAQARVLRALGCHELQGFLFSKPVPAAALAGQRKPVAA